MDIYCFDAESQPRDRQDTETCTMCGRSVALASGWFVNRVPDLNAPGERRAEGRPYPEGDWICAECDSQCPDCEDGHASEFDTSR
jgi:hypothetical protein